jgi:nucleotide-binding universal stress UspA family protein
MVRISHVLCPIDFSEFSRHALDRAYAVARAHGAAVTVLHVCAAPSGMAAGVPFGPEGPGPFILHDVDRERLTEQMTQFVGDRPADLTVRSEVVVAPSAYRGILDEADARAADLIVIGTHGRSGFDRWLVGSITEKILRHARVPVLTVPHLAPDVSPASSAGFDRVLCAIDFSDCSRTALDHAASLARKEGGQLTVLHAVELLPVMYETGLGSPFSFEVDRDELERAAGEHLRRFVPDSLRQQLAVDEVIGRGKPYAEILRVAAERHADLIVLGVHGHGVIDRLVFGSTAGHVVRRAACPVLTVRRIEASAEAEARSTDPK